MGGGEKQHFPRDDDPGETVLITGRGEFRVRAISPEKKKKYRDN